MDDPKFRELAMKCIFAVAVALVFAIPLFFIFKNKITYNPSTVIQDVRKEKTFIIYVTEDRCKNCKVLKQELEDNNINYRVLNKSREKDYNSIISELGLNKSKLIVPALIYINKGNAESFIVDIKSKEEINEFLSNYE